MSLAKRIVPTITTLGAILFAKSAPEWGTVYGSAEQKDYKGAVQNFIAAMTGIRLDFRTGSGAVNIEPFEILNPFNLEHAPVPKIALWTSLTMEGLSKINSFVRSIFNEMD